AGAAAAIRLFVVRAADAAPGFELTPGNVADVIEVCRRLDGLPLALELAANRVRALGVRDLAARIDDRFRLLTSRQRGAFDRQHTLRAVIGWSWDLLADAERTVLRRFAMHAAPCSLQAAESVCAGGEIAEFDVADLLARLVDRSLVVRVDSGSGSRYRLLETVRAYCLERLEESGEGAATERRYAAYYDRLALRSEPRLYGYGEMFARMGDIYLRHGEHDTSAVPAAGPAALTATSKDGTPIAYELRGQGPLLILVGNTLTERGALRPLAARLAGSFTTLVYDRRGRGASGDTPPYTVEREVEDLAALIDAARESVPGSGRGPAYGFGITTGAVLVAEATARGVGFAAIAVIEPPFILPGTRTPIPAGFQAHVENLVEAGRRGDAVEYFLSEAVQMAPEVLAPLRSTARWRDLEALAHTITYDTAIMNGHVLPAHWADQITAPVLVLDGGLSARWRRLTAQAVAHLLPNARHHTMNGQPHDPAPDLLAPLLTDFFLGTPRPLPTTN
ncbi:ATP-binding protein, partial [Actinocorallia lasiicapitis]